MKSKLILSLLFSLVIYSCAKSGQNLDLQVFDGKWGHLPSLRNSNPSSMFLIHQNKDDNYDICIAEYMIEKYPGIQVELEASINLWAHYIGRNISIEFNVQALPEVTDTQMESLEQIKLYYDLCGESTDLVVGEAFSNGSTLGFTQQTYSYYVNNNNSRHDVASFRRGLFLRKHKPNDSKKYNWISYESKTSKKYTKEDLLQLMIKRETIGFKKADDIFTTLPIIIHEIGHIWGLCDQYVIGNNSTNCDADYASIDEHGHVILDFDAQMSSAGWKEKYFLTKDDIKGIQKLAERFHNSHWPTKEEFEKVSINPIKKKDIEIFKINSASHDKNENKFIIDFAMSTNKPIDFKIELKVKDSISPISFLPIKLNKSVSYAHYYMKLDISTNEVEKITVKYKVNESDQYLTLEHTPEAPKESASFEEEITMDETTCESEACSS